MYYKNFKEEQVLLHKMEGAKKNGSKIGAQTLDPSQWTCSLRFGREDNYIAV